MTSDNKFFAGVVVVGVIILAAIIFFAGKKDTSPTAIDATVGQKLGSDSAKVKIVEFGDFQCPACQKAAVDFHGLSVDPDVQLIFRHFPLTNIHKNAELSSLAAEAAGNQGKFWQMYDRIYERQSDWSELADPKDTFVNYAKELGLDEAKFKDDIAADATKKIVKRDFDYGLDLGVDSTPTFYVNGKKVEGVLSAAQWQEEIKSAKGQ